MEARGPPTRERMMRELALAIEAISSDVPLLLKLEDIHWSDASTLDWLAHVARRQEPARLMVLATFRPADVVAAQQSLGDLVTELALHGRCSEIALKPLSLQAVETYLKARLGDEDGAKQPPQMAVGRKMAVRRLCGWQRRPWPLCLRPRLVKGTGRFAFSYKAKGAHLRQQFRRMLGNPIISSQVATFSVPEMRSKYPESCNSPELDQQLADLLAKSATTCATT